MPHPDVIVIADVLARVAELEMCGLNDDIENLIESSDATELVEWRELLDELQAVIPYPQLNDGYPHWDNSYYPEILIRADHFTQWCADACAVPFLPDEVIRVIKRMYKRVPFDDTVYYFSSKGLP